MSKTALVTGAGRRLGLALAHQLIDQSYQVFAHYNRSRDGIDELTERGAIAIQADFNDSDAVTRLISSLRAHSEQLDLLVNNASCFFNNQRVDDDEHALQALFNVHAMTPYKLIRDCQPLLAAADDGLVINITDIYAARPNTDYIAYCAAKAALASLTAAFAKQLAPAVRVNAIEPGPILFLPEHDDKHQQQVLSETLLQREGGLQPVIDAIFSLRDNQFITGTSIKVDGGRSWMI
ncbi:SDR family oxidoreductase [Idiomarina xiamenensis]|uniref:Short chain dehydrogenase/reductase n=1 Tax=Idiomarina xiamenensis 10-D-4 TaxID=740709 RepID=K2KK07_9GAMM|nr:SDR family NAD(P)-dependent oxidoreductase [Idiomarina xiamenensis]EKE82944.1 Short chain dehydrogenase/reductase [Idiomarina xiamenensis 10-D-4]